jgi:methyl-coenzyme M reductase subunit C
MPIGRVTQVVDCREAMGMGKGGGIAQRGTISECRYPDVIVVGMSPGRRHVTKPVCDITSGLRQQGVEYSISTLVLYAGSGVPPDAPKIAGGVLGASFGLTDKEITGPKKLRIPPTSVMATISPEKVTCSVSG